MEEEGENSLEPEFSDGISFSFLVGVSSSCNLEEMHMTNRKNVVMKTLMGRKQGVEQDRWESML